MVLDSLEIIVKELIMDVLGLECVDEIDSEASLSETYGFSSLDALQLIIKIEEKFDIVIPDEVIDDTLISSVDSIVSYLRKNSDC